MRQIQKIIIYAVCVVILNFSSVHQASSQEASEIYNGADAPESKTVPFNVTAGTVSGGASLSTGSTRPGVLFPPGVNGSIAQTIVAPDDFSLDQPVTIDLYFSGLEGTGRVYLLVNVCGMELGRRGYVGCIQDNRVLEITDGTLRKARFTTISLSGGDRLFTIFIYRSLNYDNQYPGIILIEAVKISYVPKK